MGWSDSVYSTGHSSQVLCVCVCVCVCVRAHVHAQTFASASVPNTPGRSVLAYRPQLEPMALASVVAILSVVVTWEEGREGNRAYNIVQMYRKCTSQCYPPLSNQLSSLCYRRDPGLAAGQAPLHLPSHMYVHKCTGIHTHNLRSMQSSPVQLSLSLSYNYTLSPLGLTRFLLESPSLPLSAPGRSPKDGSMNLAAASISVTFCSASPLTFQFLSLRSLTREEVIWGLEGGREGEGEEEGRGGEG